MINALTFDNRKKGYGGLSLLEDFDELNLPKGCRLLETGPVSDIHKVANLEVPAELTFFNARGDHGLNFLCPLFGVVGFTLETLCLDVMRVLDLGVTQYVSGAVFWRLLDNNFAICRSKDK